MRQKRTRPQPQAQSGSDETIQEIRGMIEQIRRCEDLLPDGCKQLGGGRLSSRLMAKADRLSKLCRGKVRPKSMESLDRNNNECCSGVGGSNNKATLKALFESHNVTPDSLDQEHGEISSDSTSTEAGRLEEGKAAQRHQEFCLCHKRKCKKCGCICPCSEHACPGCGYTSRVVMSMRAVDGLKVIANAQKSRYRNGIMVKPRRSNPRGKRFLMNASPTNRGANGECAHSVMVRVGGGFVPLVDYLKSHNKVVLSKFTRGDGSAFLSPWQPHYPGPLRKGQPRGIRYVDSVTQQLEELIFANKEAGKTMCVCP